MKKINNFFPYLALLGTTASLFGFIGLIIQLFDESRDCTAYILLAVLVIVTGIFWLFFYLNPDKEISRKLKDRSSFSEQFVNSKGKVLDIPDREFNIEGVYFYRRFEIDPPFESPPHIEILAPIDNQRGEIPKILNVTCNSFEVEGRSTEQVGRWKYRMTGKRLKNIEKD